MKKIKDYGSKSNNNKYSDDDDVFHYLCQASNIGPGKSKSFSIDNKKGSKIEVAIFNAQGKYYAISNSCKHVGGPLSQGLLREYIVTCPWHGWKYSIIDGKSPHKGGDSVDSYETKITNGKLYVNLVPTNLGKRVTKPHEAYTNLKNSVNTFLSHRNKDHQLITDADRKRNVLGISTTNLNDEVAPRKSTSEQALIHALECAKEEFNSNTLMIKLRNLSFKHCEGYYSKNAKACIFPCSISEMDRDDQMILIYEKLILWADVVVIATPIRWGSSSSLYYQMIQRMNCVQNQIITHETHLIRNKVAAFIITGGQDNVQHVAGELLAFWSQLGFIFGKFPFVGWSKGWYAEDTENNLHDMKSSRQMKKDITNMIRGAVELSKLVSQSKYDERVLRIGRNEF